MAFVGWLLKRGADVNAADEKGNKALMVAVKRKNEDAIRLLISRGADPDKQNQKGESTRSLAEIKGPKRILRLLEKT